MEQRDLTLLSSPRTNRNENACLVAGWASCSATRWLSLFLSGWLELGIVWFIQALKLQYEAKSVICNEMDACAARVIEGMPFFCVCVSGFCVTSQVEMTVIN